MAAIVEQRKESRIQPAERTDAENDVEQQERSRAKGADEQNLVSDAGEQNFGERGKNRQIESNGVRKVR